MNPQTPLSARSWNTKNIFWIVLIHLLALAAIPFFSWENFLLVVVGVFVLAPLGINVGYHRMLTHKAFTAPRWLRNSLVTLGAVLGAGPPAHWVAMHRVHHRYSDSPTDPHDSNQGFWYSHILHLFVLDAQETGCDHIATYAPDLAKDRYLMFLNRYGIYLALAGLAALFFVGGIGYVLWGGFVRTVLMWHVMWFVNSATHKWGYRNYASNDKATNCWWVGILAAGEGWHNNHHAYPTAAAHGHRWWELDISYLFIRAMELIGLVKDVKRPQES